MGNTLMSFLKQFSLSVVLGSAVGAFLVGFTVFAAFDPPTAFPPLNNVEPPLNSGDIEQTKDAGLIVNVDNVNATGFRAFGYTQIDVTAGAPPAGDCDGTSATLGRMKVDPAAAETLWICMDSGWVAK